MADAPNRRWGLAYILTFALNLLGLGFLWLSPLPWEALVAFVLVCPAFTIAVLRAHQRGWAEWDAEG